MFYAHSAVWLFLIVTGLIVWLYEYTNAKRGSFYVVVYIGFIIGIYGAVLSICALVIKLMMVMVGL